MFISYVHHQNGESVLYKNSLSVPLVFSLEFLQCSLVFSHCVFSSVLSTVLPRGYIAIYTDQDKVLQHSKARAF